MSLAESNATEFPLSLSVGTACQAKCPYCSIPELPQRITSGTSLVEACMRFIAELSPWFSRYAIRITGGEIGLVPDLSTFFAFVNECAAITTVRLYTNGLLFENAHVDLKQKCRVLDHTIHDATSGLYVRYAHDLRLEGEEHVLALIRQREPRCLRYRMIVVDSPRYTQSQRDRLTGLGIRFVEPTGHVIDDVSPSTDADVRLCHQSQWLYVYDVANDLFFHCCEVKSPARGVHAESLVGFLTGSPKSLYPECRMCRTCTDISRHRNSHAIQQLRAAVGH